MKVKLLVGRPNVNWNILFTEKVFPMKGGKFPKDHPCVANPEPMTFSSNSSLDKEGKMGNDPLSLFRKAGYSASCFPEGDGITFDLEVDKTTAQVKEDIENILKFTVIHVKD
jgi:hypothetical protein